MLKCGVLFEVRTELFTIVYEIPLHKVNKILSFWLCYMKRSLLIHNKIGPDFDNKTYLV
jgi:hypothetical protein